MKTLVASIFLLGTLCASAYQVGDTVRNHCWQNDQGREICLDDFNGYVKVVDFGAGWCGPCNTKMAELARRVYEFNGQRVIFFSNSIHGWQKPSTPTQQFLREWRSQHNIPRSMQVVAAPIAELYEFSPTGYIPSLAVIDKNNRMTFQQVNAAVSTLFSYVRQALSQP